jgi:hypothetical protein
MPRKVRELTDDAVDDNMKNGRISLREFVMAVMQADINRLEGVQHADVRRLEDVTNAVVSRIEGRIESEVAKLDLNIDAVKDIIGTQQEMNKERLDSHNKFREQIENERQDLVRKEDMARVEKEMALRFDTITEKTEAALASTQRALAEAESRLQQSFGTRDKAISEVKEKQDKLDGKWTAQTVAIAIVTIGFTALSIVLYVVAGT